MPNPARAVIGTVVLVLLANAPAGALQASGVLVSADVPSLQLILAEQELASRDGLADPVGLAQERANLATASSLLATLQKPGSFARTIALAQEGTRAQTRTLHLPWADAIVPVHASPSEAARAVLAAHQTTPTPEEEQGLLRLDVQPEPVRGALTRVLDAFLAFDAAAQRAYAGADVAKLQGLQDAAMQGPAQVDVARSAAEPGALLADAGVDLAPVFSARVAMLAAVAGLRDALDLLPERAAAAACSPVAMLPVFSIDVTTCDNTYNDDVAFLLDVGGNDLYGNNAGGSDVLGAGCGYIGHAAAALIDLAGEDRYVSGRDCGINGGGDIGVGFLFDARGDDTYTSGSFGTNGGGDLGVGFLLDASGDDTYTAGEWATNGGGTYGGQGFLLDAGGEDTYAAGEYATNGGGAAGVGFLLDAGGNDIYTARTFWGFLGGTATNGGGVEGVGFLLDAGGNDAYLAGTFGTNGGGYYAGVGFLFDAGGNDAYTAGDRGTNGGGNRGGVGVLLDASGNDTYIGRGFGANGGTSDGTVCPPFLPCVNVPASGLLLDGGGRDTYRDASTDCTDCTVVPKGLVGAQADSDDPPP